MAIVLIGSHHVSGDALLPCLSGKRADDVVSFVSRYFQDGNAVCTYNILYNRYGKADSFRSFLTLCLILFVGLMAEGRSGGIESDSDVSRVLFFEYFFQGIYKAQNGGSIEPFGVNPRALDERVNRRV